MPTGSPRRHLDHLDGRDDPRDESLAARRAGAAVGAHVGGLLIGWGGFNMVEALVDHHLLGVHHVRDDLGAPLGWDLGFLAFGALLVVVGAVLR